MGPRPCRFSPRQGQTGGAAPRRVPRLPPGYLGTDEGEGAAADQSIALKLKADPSLIPLGQRVVTVLVRV